MTVLKMSLVDQWMPVLGQRMIPHKLGQPTNVQTSSLSRVVNELVLLNSLNFRVPIYFYSIIRPRYVPAIVDAKLNLMKFSVSGSS